MKLERANAALLGLPLLCGLLAGASAPAEEIEYEASPVLDADALLGSEAIAGEHFTIEPAVAATKGIERLSSIRRIPISAAAPARAATDAVSRPIQRGTDMGTNCNVTKVLTVPTKKKAPPLIVLMRPLMIHHQNPHHPLTGMKTNTSVILPVVVINHHFRYHP